jgi:Uma2 family endonuclease
LDEAAALVVQPDIIVIRQDRLQIIRDRVWGPPDLAVEILSPSTAIWDRTTKVGWYRQHGVAECWLVDTRKHSIEVVDLKSDTRKTFVGDETIQSTVLAHWAVPAEQIFL